MSQISLLDKYALDKTSAYITGIESLVRLLILQHQRDLDRGLNTAGFVSGYRGSPLGTLDQSLWKAKPFLDKHHITFQPGVNEDLAATAVWGSQQVNLFPQGKYDGVFSMWYGKGPGVDRSMDAIKHANAAGTAKYGGVLAIAGDDHACKSSTLPHQSDHMFIGASIPILNPANVQEVLDLGIYGWELSRYTGAWVAMKAVTENMDSAISAQIDPNRIVIKHPDSFTMPDSGVHIRWPDYPLEQEERLNHYKIYAAREFARINNLNKICIDSHKPRLGIITSGKSYLDVMQALEDLGIDEFKASEIGLRVFKIGMSWPLDPISTHHFSEGLQEILVVEEKRSIIEDQLTGQLYNWPVSKRPRVVGEFDERGQSLLPNTGELTPAQIARVIATRIKPFHNNETINQRLTFYQEKERSLNHINNRLERQPHYCSGCPHNTSTQLPTGSRGLGGIGCHYMGTWEHGNRKVETFTQMGGEGASWVGQQPFTDCNHVFQNLGDGTYFHSGLLAIRQTIAAKVNITYKILYNDVVAMTGGQQIDGTLTIEGMILQLRGEGIKKIALVSDDPKKYRSSTLSRDGVIIKHRDQLLAVQDYFKTISGTSVIIYEQLCAAEKRRRRKKKIISEADAHIFINPEICEGCGDCSVQSNCLSVVPLETELGRKRQIDQSTCNMDYSCIHGFCPSFVSVRNAQLKKINNVTFDSLNIILPLPPQAPIDQQPWNIIVTGVGGSGVLTLAAIISMAAHIEGKGCATMNQTGLAQKFGSVISHVRIGENQSSINAVRIAAGDADLLLGCDLIVSVGNEALGKIRFGRSHAVINDHKNYTAEFIQNSDLTIPVTAMKGIIVNEIGVDNADFIQATELAKNLIGDSIAMNFFMLGFACQKGLIPVSVEAIERAIRLNGVNIDTCVDAFNWGRMAVVDLSHVKQLASLPEKFTPLNNLDSIIKDREQRLIRYQNRQLAQKYIAFVSKTRQQLKQKNIDSDTLMINIAKYLYQLMAYKDEYEIARLYSDSTFKQQLNALFDGNYSLKLHLAPPLFSKKDKFTGLPVKSAYSYALLKPIFSILSHLKCLRGSIFDIFGYTTERKQERALIKQYQQMINLVIKTINKDNFHIAVALSQIPRQIRGFGHIKAANIEKAQLQINTQLEQYQHNGIHHVSII